MWGLIGPGIAVTTSWPPRAARGSVLSDDLHILLIDSDDHDRALATTLLGGRFGTGSVESIATVAALLTSLARGGFDVVVAEYWMPWIEGPALLDAIQESHPGVPVIFLTSTDDTECAVAVVRAGAADYLVKSSRGFLRLATAVDDALLAEGTAGPSRPGHASPADLTNRIVPAAQPPGAGRGQRAILGAVASAARDTAGTDTPDDQTAARGDLAQLKRINAELRGLIAQTAHELDAPLRMVAQHANAIEAHAQALDSEGRQSLSLALAGVSRMQALLDDLTAYSRIEAETLRLEPCECNALVGRVADRLAARFGETKIHIQLATLPTVAAAPSQLTQVFDNLLSNGLKFQTETPAKVEVAARDVGGEWLFSVRDYGIGVEPEFTDSIFDLFRRLRPEYSGTGVGLAICRRIVERHGGRIWVESRAGEGSTFSFTLSKNPARAESTRPFAAVRSPRRSAL